MTGFGKVTIGALGGLAAVIVKALGQNRNFLAESLKREKTLNRACGVSCMRSLESYRHLRDH